jgi:NAD-dependent DNA ligase
MANIPMLGESISTRIVENFTVDEFKDFSKYTDALEKVMNHKTAFSNLLKYRSRIDRLLEKLTLVEYKKEFVGLAKMTYAVTGSLSKARKDIIKEFLSYGYEWVDPSKADVLIADAPSSSAKYKTAVKRGIPIMTEQEFRNQYII